MFKRGFFNSLILISVAVVAAVSSFSQDVKPGVSPQQPTDAGPQRPQLFRQLGLTPDQVEKIRRLNTDRKPQMDAAQRKLREAMKSLDEAIYADQVDETVVSAKIKDVQSAQSEVQRLRFMNEFAVRRILLPEQLMRFRQLRSQFAADRQQVNRRRAAGQQLDPNRRPINRVRPVIRQTQNKPPK